jgi:hypothetical protein
MDVSHGRPGNLERGIFQKKIIFTVEDFPQSFVHYHPTSPGGGTGVVPPPTPTPTPILDASLLNNTVTHKTAAHTECTGFPCYRFCQSYWICCYILVAVTISAVQ